MKKQNSFQYHKRCVNKRFEEIKDKKGIILILAIFISCLLFIGFASAAQPTINIPTPAIGLQIEHPVADTIKVGELHKFHFHVFNVTDGRPVNISLYTCTFHLYNPQGSHILKVNNKVSSDDIYDYEQIVTGGNFTTAGQYSYVFQCNNSAIGGFYEHDFQVTPTGLVGTLGFYIILLILSLLIIIIGYSVEDEWVVLIGGFGFIFLGLFILLYGIVGVKDTTYTYAFGIITIMLGAYFAVKASLSKMNSGMEIFTE